MKWKLFCLVVALVTVPVLAGGIYTNSSFNNDSDTSGSAWAQLNGQNLRVLDMGSGASLHLAGDPSVNDAYFKLRVDLSGNILSEDELPQGSGGGGGGSSGYLNVHLITSYNHETGESQLWDFSPHPLILNWNTNSWFQFNDWDQTWDGGMNANVWIDGGVVTSTSINFWENEWTEGGAPPDWWRDWNASINIDGIITATNFTAVPEPATLALMAMGGTAAFWHKKRRRIS